MKESLVPRACKRHVCYVFSNRGPSQVNILLWQCLIPSFSKKTQFRASFLRLASTCWNTFHKTQMEKSFRSMINPFMHRSLLRGTSRKLTILHVRNGVCLAMFWMICLKSRSTQIYLHMLCLSCQKNSSLIHTNHPRICMYAVIVKASVCPPNWDMHLMATWLSMTAVAAKAQQDPQWPCVLGQVAFFWKSRNSIKNHSQMVKSLIIWWQAIGLFKIFATYQELWEKRRKQNM